MNKDYKKNENTQQKCTCVPSGRCHSHTLIGCPHFHYYNEKRIWTCGINPNANENSILTIDMNPWGEYIIKPKIYKDLLFKI